MGKRILCIFALCILAVCLFAVPALADWREVLPPEDFPIKDHCGADHAGGAWRHTWLDGVSDLAPISEVNLPGTHDSGQYACSWLQFGFGKTQADDDDFTSQCLQGIRFFDVRVCAPGVPYDKNGWFSMCICHGDLAAGKSKDDDTAQQLIYDLTKLV